MANVNEQNTVPSVNIVPANYPIVPAPGKIESLYISNNKNILGRLSPKTPYTNGLLKFGPRQPFVWYSPNEGNSGVNGIKKYDSRAFPLGSALQDVVRISKFSVSGPGVMFLLKQFLLQNLQPYNETALYNPLMPIVSALRPASLGLLPRPTRHIDLGGGLLGALASVVGFSVSDNGKSSPKGTVGAGQQDNSDGSPLSYQAVGGGKGLLRARTASGGYTSLASRWGGNSSKSGFLKSMVASVFPSLIKVEQPENTGYRGDEGAYGMMANDLRGKFKKHHVITNVEIPITQIWIAGNSDGGKMNIRKKNEYPQNRKIVFVDGTDQKISGTDVTGPDLNSAPTGFKFEKDVDNVEKYGKSMGIDVNRLHSSDPFKYSIMLMNYKKFVDKANKFPTKMDTFSPGSIDLTNAEDETIRQPQTKFFEKYGFEDVPIISTVKSFNRIPTRKGTGEENRKAYLVDETYSKNRKNAGGNGNLSDFRQNLEDGKFKDLSTETTDLRGSKEDSINATLQMKAEDRLIENRKNSLKALINKIKVSGYTVAFSDNETRVFSSPDSTVYGMKKLSKENIENKKYSDAYKDSKSLTDGLNHGRLNSKKLSGAGKGDELNKLTILNKDKKITDQTDVSDWNTYDPYTDDLIAFYFYDMVNEKYIPFRASITNLNDSFQAEWTNYEYIGRADKLYSYKGFGRTLSFSFKCMASSIKELLPMWKRVNYLCGLTMPANYTQAKSQDSVSQNEFMIPPFVLLTLGDMYKEQPILINRVGLTIPDGASWEYLNENLNEDWSYLNKIITWTGSKGKFAQFPREVEVQLDFAVLQKERPITGMANFGHAPRDLTNNSFLTKNEKNPFSEGLTVERVK